MACHGLSRSGCLLILACACWFSAEAAQAADPVLARVQTVTPDHVVVNLAKPGSRVESQVIVPTPDGVPAGIEPGRLVRLWPGSRAASGGILTGARLTPLDSGRDGRRADRTGVRERLMRGAGRGVGGGRGGR